MPPHRASVISIAADVSHHVATSFDAESNKYGHHDPQDMPKEHGRKSFLKTSMTAIFVVDLPVQFIKEKLLLELHGTLRYPGVVLAQIKPRGLSKCKLLTPAPGCPTMEWSRRSGS